MFVRADGQRQQQFAAVLKIHQRGGRHTIALAAGEVGSRNGIGAAVVIQQDEVVDRAAGQAGEQGVAGTEVELRRIDVVAAARTQPAVPGDNQCGRFVGNGDVLGIRQRDAFGGFDQGTAVVAIFAGVGFDFARDTGAQRRFRSKQGVQAGGFFAQPGQFFADLEAFEAGQLAQPDFQDVFGLDFSQLEMRHQIGLGLVGFADDADDAVDVEQDGLPAFEDVDAFFCCRQAVAGASFDRLQAEAAPFGEHVVQRALAGGAREAEQGQVDRGIGFQAGMGEQQADQVLLVLA